MHRTTPRRAYIAGSPHRRLEATRAELSLQPPLDVQVVAFDVFGTVVDWHGSITREMASRYPDVDGDAFARAWRAGYHPAMERVMSGELAWAPIDALHRMVLDEILPEFGLQRLGEAERRDLNRVWHRLAPWPDTVEGLTRLKQRYLVCTLSNGNIGLLARMARHAGLPWDCVLSAEMFRAYKPAPATYLGVARVFDVEPSQVMLVAAHPEDLAAAARCGLRTAYIDRPLEFGPGRPPAPPARGSHDLHCTSVVELARVMGT